MYRKGTCIKMKKMTILALLAISILIISCDDRETVYIGAPPAVPTGINTITMDGAVRIEWYPVILDPDYNDLAGYRVWRSIDNDLFTAIATIDENETYYVDNNVSNGTTYYYGVSAFDNDGNESDASFNYEIAFDTPRPEGFEVIIYTFNAPNYENRSGFDLSTAQRLYWDDAECDFYLEFDTSAAFQTYFLWLGESGALIQDMGYTDSFDDITYAPEGGWSSFDYIEAIEGHTYIIVTDNEHYAKIRITDTDTDPVFNITFDWGYQIDQGNRELRIEPGRKIITELSESLE